MSWLIAGLTYPLLALPVVFAALAAAGSGPAASVLGLTAVFVALIYAFIWTFMRPTRLVLTDRELRVEFPLRVRRYDRRTLTGARALTSRELRAEAGWAMRIGAGGLWGGFGALATQRRGTLDMYITRHDRFVLVERGPLPGLLLSPDPEERFVAMLAARPGPAAARPGG